MPTLPLQTIIPAYPYQEYSDDENIVAWFTAVNQLAQPYLDWFNQTPLAVYTNPTISGPLLDWVGEGIYGIARPVFSSLMTHFSAGINSGAINARAINGKTFSESGAATIAADDYYKRVLTWWLYAGNGGNGPGSGRHFNVFVLRLRVARFLYGENGTDVTLSQAQTVNIQPALVPSPGAPVLSQTPSSSSFLEDESGHSVLGSSGSTIGGEAAGMAAANYVAALSFVSPIGETTIGAAATKNVSSGDLLVVASPSKPNGAIFYNVYVAYFSANPSHLKGALNTRPVNGYALNGTSKRAQAPLTLQNNAPIPIGVAWTEPPSGLVAGRQPPNTNTSNTSGNFIINVPSGVASTYFQEAFGQGLLAFPFQLTGTVLIG